MISGDNVYFLPEDAKKYGVESAVAKSYLENIDLTYITFNDLEYIFPFYSERKRKNILEKMCKQGLIKEIKLDQEYVVNLLKSKSKSKFPSDNNFSLSCEWCNSETIILHQHHYPERKKNGGKNVVKICPNCHQEFHFLCDYKKYVIKKIDSEVDHVN